MYDIRGEWCGSRRLVVDEPLSLPHQPGPSRITETTTFHGAGMAVAVAFTLGSQPLGVPAIGYTLDAGFGSGRMLKIVHFENSVGASIATMSLSHCVANTPVSS
jgi:hypothetical protein